MEFDNKSFWKFTTALGRKLPDGRLFFTKKILTVYLQRTRHARYWRPAVPPLSVRPCALLPPSGGERLLIRTWQMK